MTASKPRIAIVGAGIGGLTLGLLLRKHGVEARIYEQASELREVGAAVALAANGTRVMRRLGLGDELQKFCVEPTDVVYRHWARVAHPDVPCERLLRESGFTAPEVYPSRGLPSHFLIPERAG